MIGAIAGDIIGSVYEHHNIKNKEFELFSNRCFFTDDSILTVALADSILTATPYVDNLIAFYRWYPEGGYGGSFRRWALSPNSGPYNSWGNGAAMRISPAGYAYNDLETVLKKAKEFTEVTHNHPEGIKGGQAVAAAIFLARTGESKDAIKAFIEGKFQYNLSKNVDEIRPAYRFDVSCQGTVPQAIRAFIDSSDFEDAIRTAVSLGGDTDTLTCITGGIAQAFYGGVPEPIQQKVYSILDGHLGQITRKFMELYCSKPMTNSGPVEIKPPIIQDNTKSILKRQLDIPRYKAAALGQETTGILNSGFYISPGGTKVEIQNWVNESVQGTVTYSPEIQLPEEAHLEMQTTIEVKNETTLNGVKRLISMGYANPVALNFASAESPGGGFLKGSLAQEEYLARSSSLYSCLQNNPMYRYHRSRQDPFYSDYVIYSPDVVIIRDDDSCLLEVAFKFSVITSPAVHAKGVRHYLPERENEIAAVMWKRILKVLAVAVENKLSAIVLGAWGCGAFGNEGSQIAALFQKALDNNFRGAFEYVVFAITDWSPEDRFIGPFLQAFSKELT